MYIFSWKCINSTPKCANSLPWQGKCTSNSTPGVVGEKKFDFSTRGILARPGHAPTYPAKQCLGKKHHGLVPILSIVIRVVHFSWMTFTKASVGINFDGCAAFTSTPPTTTGRRSSTNFADSTSSRSNSSAPSRRRSFVRTTFTSSWQDSCCGRCGRRRHRRRRRRRMTSTSGRPCSSCRRLWKRVRPTTTSDSCSSSFSTRLVSPDFFLGPLLHLWPLMLFQ